MTTCRLDRRDRDVSETSLCGRKRIRWRSPRWAAPELKHRNANQLRRRSIMRILGMTLTAGVLALGLAAGIAQAMPLSNSAAGLKTAADESNLIVHVDACNRVCRKGVVAEWGG